MRRKTRTSRHNPWRLALAAGIVAFAAGHALAQAVPGTALTDAEKTKLKKTLALLEAVWDDCGVLGNTLDAQFNPPSQSGQGSQVTYENGGTTTLKQAIATVRKMVAEGRVRKENLGDNYGYTRPAPGTDKDYIVVNSRDIEKICRTGAFAGISDADAAVAKINMAATLANELTHVFHVFDGTDLKQCDAERDSDSSHIKFLEGIVKTLEDDVSGNPHTTTAQVGGDGKAGPILRKCLEDLGVTTPAEIKEVYDKAESVRAADADRKQTIFEDHILAGTSWGKDYYGSTWRRPIKFPRRVLPANDRVELESFDKTALNQFVVAPGAIVNQSIVFETGVGDLGLVVVSNDPLGTLFADLYLDTNADGLPELPAVASVVFPPSPAGPLALGPTDVMIYPGLEPSLTLGGTDNGLMFIDTIRGDIFTWELDPLGVPVTPTPQLFVSDPLFSDAGGGFYFLNSYWELFPGQVQYIFSDTPNVMQFGNVDAIKLDILGGLPLLPIGPIDPLGTTATPDLIPPGLQGLELATQAIVLGGNTGSTIQLDRVGHGAPVPVANGTPGPDGAAPPQAPANPVIGNELYYATDGVDRTIYFLPSVGRSMDTAFNDENGDGGEERFDLTTEPSRIHLFAGFPGQPIGDPLKQHAYEMVLEDPGLDRDYAGFLQWGLTGRSVLMTTGDAEQFLPLPGSLPPLFAQSLHDFDYDGFADDTVIIRRPDNQPDFFLEVIRDADSTPVPIQLEQLHLVSVEPIVVIVNSENRDQWLLDIHVEAMNPANSFCGYNNGAGQFVFAPCSCSIADITTQGAGAGDPLYGIPDAQVTAADLNFYVNAWVAGDVIIADFTTTGAPIGDPLYGVPDGSVSAADLQFYVNAWVVGCP